jgi:hypothetical protein
MLNCQGKGYRIAGTFYAHPAFRKLPDDFFREKNRRLHEHRFYRSESGLKTKVFNAGHLIKLKVSNWPVRRLNKETQLVTLFNPRTGVFFSFRKFTASFAEQKVTGPHENYG